MSRVVLYTRDGCSLCAEARLVVDGVLRELPGGAGEVTEVDVDGDLELRAEYGDLVPVVTVDDVVVGYYTIEAERLGDAVRG